MSTGARAFLVALAAAASLVANAGAASSDVRGCFAARPDVSSVAPLPARAFGLSLTAVQRRRVLVVRFSRRATLFVISGRGHADLLRAGRPIAAALETALPASGAGVAGDVGFVAVGPTATLAGALHACLV